MGGGKRFFPSLWVLASRLRQLGCNLPVEAWMISDYEIDPKMRELLGGLGVSVMNVSAITQMAPFRFPLDHQHSGWALKPYCIKWSKFQEVMFIDADCCPVTDPTYLFDTPEYQSTGTIFWPDYYTWQLGGDVYKTFGVDVPEFGYINKPKEEVNSTFGQQMPAGYDSSQESGQMLIDKGRHWLPLSVADWLCQHADWTFMLIYGDKETFRLAWKRLNAAYAMPRTWPGWEMHTELQHDFSGTVIFLHRTQDKWSYDGANRRSAVPTEDKMLGCIGDLQTRWNGIPWLNEKPGPIESKHIKQISQTKLAYIVEGQPARQLVLEPDGTISSGEINNERFWSFFIDVNTPAISILNNTKDVCAVLHQTDAGWKGYTAKPRRACALSTNVDCIFISDSKTLNLGCGLKPITGAVNHDLEKHAAHVDVSWDLNKYPYPWESDQFEQVVMDDVMEHLDDVVKTMDECWRIMKLGGIITIKVPRWDHWTSWCDPTHKRTFMQCSFEYFTNEGFGKTFPFYTKYKWKQIRAEVDDGNIVFQLMKTRE
jgi:hypothetical protein